MGRFWMDATSRRSFRRFGAIFILMLFLTSLTQVAGVDCPGGHSSSHYGVDLAAMGWLAAFGGQFAWYANPLMMIMIVQSFLGRQLNIRLALPMLALALDSLFWTWWGDDTQMQTICHYGLGFYLWNGCAISLAALSLFEFFWPLQTKAP